MTASVNLSFRAPEALMKQFKSRDRKGVRHPGSIVKRDIERWYSLLADGLKEVTIEPAEAVVMIYYVNIFDGEPDHLDVVSSATRLQGRPIGLSEEFDPIRDSLAEKMATWSQASVYAVWDAAERYQVRALAGSTDTFGMALHHVGLHSYHLSPEELRQIEQMAAVEADSLPGEYLRALEESSSG